jgi:ADP-ribose pyrophosphatase YjhB (NUDIX family)
MARPFDDTTRRHVAERCAAFTRLPAAEPAPTLKRAAVVIALVEADDASPGTALLLTMRAADLRAHRGQWALPGGRCDEGETPVEASLRELHEELGLELSGHDVLGRLDDYPTRSGYLITPVVVWAATRAAIVPNPAEVASGIGLGLTISSGRKRSTSSQSPRARDASSDFVTPGNSFTRRRRR